MPKCADTARFRADSHFARWRLDCLAGHIGSNRRIRPRAKLDGTDLRREPFETRKATLTSLLRGSLSGVRLNEHLPQPGDLVFRNACKMGLEGIVWKRLGSRYRSGRSPDWLKMKNPISAFDSHHHPG